MLDRETSKRLTPRLSELKKALIAGTPPVPIDEHWLWAFAMGTLDPDEEETMMRALATNEPAQTQLENIRTAIAAAVPAVIKEPSESVLQKLVAALKVDLSELEAGFERVAGGLRTALLGPEWKMALATARTLRSGQAETPPIPGAAAPRCEIMSKEGHKVTIIDVPRGGVTIVVQLAVPRQTGFVEVWRLVPRGKEVKQEKVDSRQPDVQGRVQFDNCPDGVLRIIRPDGKGHLIALAPRKR